jgi:hypothetical protein
MRFVWPTLSSTSKDRHQYAKHNANDDAGDDREIKRALFALDPDVAGQAPKPFWRHTASQDRAEDERNRANDHQDFSQVAHVSEGCVKRRQAQG